MNEKNLSSLESQHKIVKLLKDEFVQLNLAYGTNNFKKKMSSPNFLIKKLKKLSFKVTSILKINHLNPEILDELSLLQQEIDEYIQK
ncbi:MAG: hypothetical protein JSS34_00530 [Proteobacteria bacterium]|nr:hypothetical protein [Pseudomonadota bacterium]